MHLITSTLPANLRSLYSYLSNKNKLLVLLVCPLLFLSVTFELLSSFLLIPVLSTVLIPDTSDATGLLATVNTLFSYFEITLNTFNIVYFSICISVVAVILRILIQFFREYTLKSVVTNLSSLAYHTVISQPYAWHLNQDSHKLSVKLDSIDAINSNIFSSLLNIFNALSIFLCSFIIALISSWRITLYSSILLFTVYYLLTFLSKHRLRKNSVDRVTARQQMTSVRYNSFSFMSELIVYNMHSLFEQRYNFYDHQLRNCQFELGILSSIPKLVIEFFAIVFISLFALSVSYSGRPEQSISILFVFAISIQKCLPQFNSSFSSLASIRSNKKFLSDFNSILSLPHYNYTYHGSPLTLSPGLIVANNLEFAYTSRQNLRSKHYNLQFETCKMTSLSGSSGVGKTTLLNLFMGLLIPSKGEVYFSPFDTQMKINLPPLTLRNACTLVPQDAFIFNDSLDNNILGCSLPLSDEALVLVKSICAIDHTFFDDDLSLHSHLKLGDNGSLLSGGQKQRIGIARALYSIIINEKPLLFLDEAFNGINFELESQILSNIRSHFPQLTVLSITHNQRSLCLYDNNINLS